MMKFIALYRQKVMGKRVGKTVGVGVLSAVALSPVIFTVTSALNAAPSTTTLAATSAALTDRPTLPSLENSTPAPDSLLALQAGEVSVTGDAGQYVGQVVATGSIDTAWAVLTDYNNFASFFPDVEESQLLETNGNEKVFEQVNVIHVFPFAHRSRVVVSAVESYPQQIAFSVIDGEVKSLQGVWQIASAGSNQVLVTHRVSIDPGDSPAGDLFLNLYKDSLDDTMAAIGQEITRREGG